MGHGCKRCSNQQASEEYFIEKSINIHGEKFRYDHVVYEQARKEVKNIECKIHGLFDVSSAAAHYRSHTGACPQCVHDRAISSQLKYSSDNFIEKCIEKHGLVYDYSLVEYTGAKQKVKIICPIHGLFNQQANLHAAGSGCPKCSLNKRWNRHL
jgi:hypothetical protein